MGARGMARYDIAGLLADIGGGPDAERLAVTAARWGRVPVAIHLNRSCDAVADTRSVPASKRS